MAKIVLDDVAGGYNLTNINSNFQKIEDELNNKVLYRDPEGEPNTLDADLDANNKTIYNVGVLSAGDIIMDGVSLEDQIQRAEDAADRAEASADTASHIYAGSFTSDPLTRPDGSPIQLGDLYFNAVSNLTFRWNGSTWVATNIDMASLAGSTGSSLVGFIQAGTNAVARTVQAELREEFSVTQFAGTDPTGVSSSVAGFQSAINATPDSGVQTIRVPRGIYAGDMTTLTYGSRTVIWDEEAGVSYPDAFPSQTRSTQRSLPPMLFEGSIIPSRHLKAFSTRSSNQGDGALAGAVTIAAGAITAIAVALGGTGYVTPRVLITGDGSGATATATVAGGIVTGFVITAGGAGYTTASVYVVEGPVVVLAGDSISTEQATPANFNEHKYALLRSAIGAQNLKRNITFFNRAVGAQTFTSFNGVANSNLPSWYSNPAKPWIDYISELQPDVVIVAFGMNDKEDFVFSQFQAAITKLILFTQRPDVILCTPLVPSKISANPSISSDVAQNGRDAIATYLRGYCLANGFGFLDFNRQLRLVRDGVDVRNSALREVFATVSTPLPWTAGVTCGDFYLRSTFPAIPVGWWTGRVLNWNIGTTGTNTLTQLRIDDNAGRIRITVRDIEPNTLAFTNQFQYTTSFATPTTGDVSIDISVLDTWLNIRVNDTDVFAGFAARFGGTFAPSLDIGTVENATLTFCAGEFAQYPRRLTDYELWGYGASGDYKGNALNHPTSLGVKYVMAPVINNTDWTYSPVTLGTETFGVVTNHGINEPNPRARLHITKTKHTTTLTPAANANNMLLEDTSAVGMSMMTGPTGVTRIVSGDDGNASQWVMSYNHNSDTYSETLNGVNLRTMTATKETRLVPTGVPSHTVGALPSAGGLPSIIYVSNEVGGAVLAFNDGSNWRRVTDRAIVS